MTMKQRVANRSQIAKGKVKARLGKTTGSRELRLKGGADQMKGHLKQAAQSVVRAFKG